MTSTTDQSAATPLQAAVEAIDHAVEDAIKLVETSGLGDLGAFGLVATLQSLERVRNKLPVIDRTPIQYGTEQVAPATLSERGMTRMTTGLTARTASQLSSAHTSRSTVVVDSQ